MRGKHGQELCCGFHDKEWARQGKLPGLAGLTNFSCLWAIGVVPSCLVLAWGWLGKRNIAFQNVRAREGRQVGY